MTLNMLVYENPINFSPDYLQSSLSPYPKRSFFLFPYSNTSKKAVEYYFVDLFMNHHLPLIVEEFDRHPHQQDH